MDIKVKKLSLPEAEKIGILQWPIWEKEESFFDWYYDEKESCYFLEGEVEVEIPDGRKIQIQEGDFVTFPKGLKCTWTIKKDIRKHYRFE